MKKAPSESIIEKQLSLHISLHFLLRAFNLQRVCLSLRSSFFPGHMDRRAKLSLPCTHACAYARMYVCRHSCSVFFLLAFLFASLLQDADSEVYRHLVSLEIQPQLFLL